MSLEGNEAVLELDATISFTAGVSYRNPDMEWHHKSADLDRTESVPVEVTIRFDRDGHLNYEVTAAKVNNFVESSPWDATDITP